MRRPEALKRMRRPARIRLGLGLAALVTGAVTGFSRPSGAASTYSATAAGEIVRMLVRVEPPVLQADLFDPGAVAAQASFTSFGESTAFASNPYPGSLPVAMPGVMDGLIDGSQGFPPELAEAIDLPDYPFIANSSYPNTPSAKVTAGPVVLTSESEERASRGAAVDGGNRTEALVSAATATDTVTARATAEVGTLDLAPLLTMSGVRSVAQVVQTASGARQRSSEFTAASLVVLGQSLRITPQGLELAGLNVPVGGAGSVDQLLAALEEQGLRLRFLAATETADGIVSAGLLVSRRFESGVNGAVTTVQSTIGRTYAATSNTARPPLPVLSDFPSGDGLDAFPSGGVASPADPGAAAPLDPAFPAPAAGGGGAGPAFPALPSGEEAAAPVGPPGTALPAAISVETLPARGLVPERTDAGRFYPVLVLGGALLVIAVSLFRKIGVKPTWT